MPELDNAGALRASLVVVGAGPAGLAAALAAAQAGVDVVLLDAAPGAGGQIWRARRGLAVEPVARALRRLARAGVRVLTGTRVVLPLPDRTLLLDGPAGAQRLHWARLVLATGARERLLPFPGWTLPGVFGAGGLQALVKGGWPVRDRRVLVAGTGPLLLAAAATLRREGARLVGLVEEARPAALARFTGALVGHPGKALQAVRLGASLAGVPWFAGWRVVAAQGDGRVEQIVIEEGGRTRTIACDALAAGWGLIPQTELGQSLGCVVAPRFGADALAVDASQRTNISGVFAVGECSGVAGVVAAQLQGEIAGRVSAAELLSAPLPSPDLAHRLAREHAFAEAVSTTFAPPPAWRDRLRDDTLVCRCEDVTWSALRDHADMRSAKLATRCGMGHCQGRLCHDTLASLMHWPRLPVRPPLSPAPLATLLALSGHSPDTPTAPEEKTQ
ncbi:MAG: FAD/NAD(P)-binding oxidoreductase [Burkholderiaceae bacterium]